MKDENFIQYMIRYYLKTISQNNYKDGTLKFIFKPHLKKYLKQEYISLINFVLKAK